MLKKEYLDLLCDPDTHEPLTEREGALVNPRSGTRFPLRDGIPCFVQSPTGLNLKYQSMYDRLALFYDAAEKVYWWLVRKEGFRGFLRDVLEFPPKARVLEVSVGTGANLPYVPADAEFYGLDLSWGMLVRCQRKLARSRREAFLCQGEGERLPFRDSSFDTVFHVGGINFFNDRARAIREMIRVARPGTRIAIADETEEAVQTVYERTPWMKRFFKSRATPVAPPTDLLPSGVREVRLETIMNGKVYVLSFRAPSSNQPEA